MDRRIQEAIDKDNLVFFVGAGLSIRFELPKWNELVFEVINELNDDGKLNPYKHLLSDKTYTPYEILCMLDEKNKLEYDIFYRYIETRYKISAIKRYDFSLHEKMLRVSNKIITTNIDNAFEIAANGNIEPKHISSKYNMWKIIASNEPYIFKLHGSYNEPDNCILLKKNYDSLYNNGDKAAIHNLKTIFSSKTIVFLGFSFSDEDINKIFNHVSSLFDNLQIHYIITDTPEEYSNSKFLKTISVSSYEDTDKIISSFLEYKLSKSAIQSTLNTTSLFQKELSNNSFEKLPKGKYGFPDTNSDVYIPRTKYLTQINIKLQKSSPIYIHAIGGLGKTTIARNFCKLYSKKYDYIFWINTNANDTRIDIVGSEIFPFKRDENDNIDKEFPRFVRQALSIKGKVLLIIDNVYNKKQIASIEKNESIPSLNWDVLVTTRTIIKEKSIVDRCLMIEEMNEKECIKLFYSHYDDSLLNKKKDNDYLLEILRLLKFHTYLIVLVAKVGYRASYSLQRILSLLKEGGLSNEELQTPIYAETNMTKEYIQLYNHIQTIFNFGDIDNFEQHILTCFSILPDRLHSEKKIIQFFKSSTYSDFEIKEILRNLSEEGWLIQERGLNSLYYKCHNLIQTVVKAKFTPNVNNCRLLIENVRNYFFIEDGECYTHLIADYDCIDSILNSIGGESQDLFILKMNYVKLLNRNNYSPEKAFSYAKSLKNDYELIFPKENNKSWIIRQLEINKLYTAAYLNGSSDKGKYSIIFPLRKESYNIAIEELSESDYEYFDTIRIYAMSLRENSQYIESIQILENIIMKIKGHSMDINKNKVIYKELLNTLGISYNAYARFWNNDGNIENYEYFLNKALAVRKECKDLALSIYPENHISMLNMYNNLGKNYLFLCKYEIKDEYLKNAEYYLLKSFKIRKKEFGENCLSMALSMNNIAHLYEYQKRYDEGLEYAYKALSIRKDYYPFNENYRVFMFSYSRIASLYYTRWKENDNVTDLNYAQENIDKAMKIAEHVYAENKDNHIYKSVLNDQLEIYSKLNKE